MSEIKDPTPAVLFDQYTNNNIVARGLLHPLKDGKIHGVCTLPCYIKVSIDSITSGHENLELMWNTIEPKTLTQEKVPLHNGQCPEWVTLSYGVFLSFIFETTLASIGVRN